MRHFESDLQIACVRWFRCNYPKGILFSVPNGGYRNPTTARVMKAEGQLAGVSDLIGITPSGKPLFIEMKDLKGKQSESQKAFQQAVEERGCVYVICRSLSDFQRVIREEFGAEASDKELFINKYKQFKR